MPNPGCDQEHPSRPPLDDARSSGLRLDLDELILELFPELHEVSRYLDS